MLAHVAVIVEKSPLARGRGLELSMEASLSVALLMMWNERQDEAEAKRLEYLVHLMEAVRDGLVVARGLDARNAGGGVASPGPPPQD